MDLHLTLSACSNASQRARPTSLDTSQLVPEPSLENHTENWFPSRNIAVGTLPSRPYQLIYYDDDDDGGGGGGGGGGGDDDDNDDENGGGGGGGGDDDDDDDDNGGGGCIDDVNA